MSDHLVISALGNDQPGIVKKLSAVILDQHCNIADSRMAVLGGEFAIILLVNGTPEDIEQLQQRLDNEQQPLGLTITCRQTHNNRTTERPQRPYTVEAVALDHPGIVQRLAGFFADRHLNIENLNTSSYPAAHTGTPMFRLQMHINTPAETDINALREQFIEFCDNLTIDASLEPGDQD